MSQEREATSHSAIGDDKADQHHIEIEERTGGASTNHNHESEE